MKKPFDMRRSNPSGDQNRDGYRHHDDERGEQRGDGGTYSEGPARDAAPGDYPPGQHYTYGRDGAGNEGRREPAGPKGTARTSRAQMFRRRRRLR